MKAGFVFALFLCLLHTSLTADPCADAPNENARIICHHIHNWDDIVRKSQLGKAKTALPPGQKEFDTAAAQLASVAVSLYDCMTLKCVCEMMNDDTAGGRYCRNNGQRIGKAIRKEYRMMSDDERTRFHDAIKQMKESGTYDYIAKIHSDATDAGSAHSGPAFLPWHREYLKRFEFVLREIDPALAVPYWDQTLDQNLQNSKDSIIFSPEFMGEHDKCGRVTVGPFANWRTLSGNNTIMRKVGAQGKLFDDKEIAYLMSKTRVEQMLSFTAPQQGCPYRINYFDMEYLHGNAHIYVGGDMFDTLTSANDPIFFIHHSFVDFLWEQWRQRRQSRGSRETSYPADNQRCSTAQHFASSPMSPFTPLRNIDGLSNAYTDDLYQYAPRPRCTASNTNCGSQYIFCDLSHGAPRCASKMRTGAVCSMYNRGENPCAYGHCQSGRCVRSNGAPSPPTQRQSAPIRRTNSNPTRLETCFNENKCCASWAASGECTRNANYMNVFCKASCGRCQPQYRFTDVCEDHHRSCASWALYGRCNDNKPWMAENCRKSCKKCGRSRSDQCSASYQPNKSQPKQEQCKNSAGCYNENACCPYWSLLGGCRNSQYMACNCRVSCGYCVPQDYFYGSCEDYSPRCGSLSRNGDCQRNAWVTENCRASCGSCFSQYQLHSMCLTRPGSATPFAPAQKPQQTQNQWQQTQGLLFNNNFNNGDAGFNGGGWGGDMLIDDGSWTDNGGNWDGWRRRRSVGPREAENITSHSSN